MNTKDNNTKTLRFPDDTDEKLGSFVLKFGRRKQRFFEQTVCCLYKKEYCVKAT